MTDQRLMTAREVAALLHIHINTLSRWAKRGDIPFYRLGMTPQGHLRFDPADVEKFLEARKNQ